MVALKPFVALRYASQRVDLAAVLGDEGNDPRHVRRLLAADAPGAAPRVALFVSEWRRAGVLLRDAQPAITVVRRRVGDAEALGFFAVIPLAELPALGVEPRADAARAAVFEAARVAVEPAVVEGDDAGGRMRRTLDGAADREPDATLELADATYEAFVVDDDTTAARLAAVPLADARVAVGHDALAAHAAWWSARTRGSEDVEGHSGGFALVFFCERKDAWLRVPTGLAMAPLGTARIDARVSELQ